MKWRGLQFSLQFIGLAFFGVIVYGGLFGTPEGGKNVASVFTWLMWWTLIPVTMLVAARGWCLICPWIAPGEWQQRHDTEPPGENPGLLQQESLYRNPVQSR